jgi:hypothetical protein
MPARQVPNGGNLGRLLGAVPFADQWETLVFGNGPKLGPCIKRSAPGNGPVGISMESWLHTDAPENDLRACVIKRRSPAAR